jgi:4'-phosphopantetheinyl transferase
MPGYYFTDFGNVSEQQYRHWLSVVSEERSNAATAYRFRKDAMLSLTAYLLLEHALQCRGDTKDQPTVFYRNEHGKPYLSPLLEQSSGPFFSLSHTDGIAACYLAENEVGIDVEHVISAGNELVPTICSPEEQSFFSQSGFSDEHLTRFWVLKESCLKSIGAGLSLDPRSLDFSRYREESTFSATLLSKNFSFSLCTLLPGTLAAICIQGQPEMIQWTRLEASELCPPFILPQKACRSSR